MLGLNGLFYPSLAKSGRPSQQATPELGAVYGVIPGPQRRKGNQGLGGGTRMRSSSSQGWTHRDSTHRHILCRDETHTCAGQASGSRPGHCFSQAPGK